MRLLFMVTGLLVGSIFSNLGVCSKDDLQADKENFIRSIVSTGLKVSSCYDETNYEKAFGENFTPPSDWEREFCLEDGTDIKVSYSEIVKIEELGFPENVTIEPKTLTSSFQKYTAQGDKFSFKFQASRVVGKSCHKFNDYYSEIALAILQNKDAYIAKGSYIIKIIEYAGHSNDLLKITLCQDSAFFRENTSIRYCNPNNQGNDYCIFIKSLAAYSSDYGSENIFCKFTVEQVIKDF